jgi:hypothetical protein
MKGRGYLAVQCSNGNTTLRFILKKIGQVGVDWIHLAQNSDLQWVLVNSVMDL